MKCFVTGATGHIGNVLVKKLYNAGHQVYSLMLNNDDIRIIEPYTKIIYGDILDKNRLLEVIKDFDVVIHLAGIVEIRLGRKRQIYQVNVGGTRNILEASQKNLIPKLIYTSSVHAIEERPNNEVIYEPKDFNHKKIKGHYAKTKSIATEMILNQESKSLETIVIYPSGVIGPYDYKLSNFGQVFTDYLLGRLTAYLKGGYNFVDVRDVADGIISAMTKGEDKEGYILSGHAITVKELLDYIAEYTNRKKVKTKLAFWFIKSMSYFAELYFYIIRRRPLFTHYSVSVLNSNYNFCNNKAKEVLDFKTRDIHQSIRDTVDFSSEYYLEKVGNKYRKKSFH
jgi:dihydroflavonol-4-reductase